MRAFLGLVLVIVLITTSVVDIRDRRIPNSLILFGALPIFLQPNLFIILVLVFALFSAVLFGRFIGAGDIKLASLIAAYSHLLSLSQLWIYCALLSGGIFAFITRQRSIAFAPFMAFGVLIAILARTQSII